MSVTAPEPIAAATEDHPAARLALATAVSDPYHAYLLAGPRGSGKARAARALAAELLAEGAPDPDEARRRALADPSPHPDLVWLRPPGAQHLVTEVRERVIAAIAYRPFEGSRRVFVIEAAEAMAEESQNALLKTLEEPPAFAHLVLVSAEPEALLETVRSRCRLVRFGRLAPEAVEQRLDPASDPAERRAVARLCGGDAEQAAFLLGPEGRALRAAAEGLVRAAAGGDLAGAPWRELLAVADAAGERESEAVLERAAAAEEEAAERTGAPARRRAREAEELAKRSSRAARTRALDLGLALVGAWLRDLAAVADRAADLILNSDRRAQVETLASGIDARRARRGGELVMETRRRLGVNVSEELALEALAYRLEFLLSD